MATRFEVAMHGGNTAFLRAAAEEALDEVDLWESLLSIYRPSSELARVNALAAHQCVRIDPRVFSFLQHARDLSVVTAGAFDITAAPLLQAWGFIGGSGAAPDPVRLEAARGCVGWHHVHLDTAQGSVRFDQPGVMLDPGAIGKGYALDRAVNLLRDAGIENALIHGGTSTVCAMGHPPDAEGWTIALPPTSVDQERGGVHTECLRDQSLSVSAAWGKSFIDNGLVRGHVLDPRTGQPVSHATMAMVVTPTATESDAFSTALLVLGREGVSILTKASPVIRCHVQ
jgi:thiamine biosynthesis lipoprotein